MAHRMRTEGTASVMYGSIVLQEHWQLEGHLLGSEDRQKTKLKIHVKLEMAL